MFNLSKNRIDRQSIGYSKKVVFKHSTALRLLLILLVSAISYNKSVAQTCTATITTIAGIGTVGHYGDGGPATAAYINQVHGIIRDNSGNIYISDRSNQRIRKITTGGLLITIAGNGSGGPDGDGGPASAAKVFSPSGLALDTSGNLYIADQNNHKIRRISTSGIITTVVGTGTGGFAGDGGHATAARLSSPSGVAFDLSGNMYIADNGNHRIRRVTPSGTITTYGGKSSALYSGDGGQATAAGIPLPDHIAVDNSGNVYVTSPNTHRVRKIATTGIISTIAGTGIAGNTGDGGQSTAARLNSPRGVHVDAVGNIYITNTANHTIRKINTSGVISTIAGTGLAGYSGDGGIATAAAIWEPWDLTSDSSGNIYFADRSNYRIRKIGLLPPTITISGSSNICISSFTSLTASIAGGTWTTSNASVATVGTSGIVSGISSGTAIISYSNSYDCGTAIATRIVTVNAPAVTPTITGSTNICVGSGTTLSGTPTGGTWTSSSPSIATINSSSGFVNPLTLGTTTISYSVSASCGTYIATSTVTVNAGSSAGTTSGPSSVCIGSTITLTNSVGGGTWNSSNTSYATVDSAGVVTPVTPGSVVNITYSVSGVCGLVTANKIVTVNGLPYPGDISGIDSFCVGGTRTLSIYGAAGGTWSSSNTAIVAVVSSGSSTATITGVSGGNAVISYTSTNTCGSVTATYAIRIDPVLSAGIISGPTSVAADSSILLSCTSSSGSWYSSNMYWASIDASGVLTGHEAGTVTVSYLVSNSCGTYVSSHSVTITPSIGSTSSCSGIISTIAGNGTIGFTGDGGPATAAAMYYAHGLTVDSVGNVYFGDWLNNRIRKISTSGIISTVVGNGVSSFSGDGGPATAAGISQPTGVVFDRHGNMIICDQGTNRIRKVSTSGIITTIAGTGFSGYNGDGIPATAANLGYPKNIAVDKDDNVYIADYSNYRVRKVSPAGIITTIAGNGSVDFSGDYGPATAAGIYPYDVDVDEQGNVYVATYFHYRIRKIVPSGKIYTVAGGGLSGHHTEGGAATSTFLYLPMGVAVDKSGNLYCSTFGDHKAYKVSPLGTINIIAGTGTPGFSGDGIMGNASALNYPRDVAVDKSGNLYIADDYNQRIRRVRTGGAPAVSGIYGPDTLCMGATMTLLDTTTGGIWLSSDTSVATVSATGIVTGINSGNTVIRYYKTNGCGVGGQSLMLRVNGPAFAGNPYGTFSTCVGSTATVMSSILGGTWSSANNSIATVNAVTGLVTGVSPGLVNISYTVPGTCGSGFTLKQFTVNGTTATGSISGPDTICTGTSTILTSTLFGGSWLSTNPSVATIGGDGNVNGLSAGTTIISYVSSTSCGIGTSTKILTVLSSPSAGTISGATTLCTGSSTLLTNTIPGGNWSSTNPAIATIATTGNILALIAGTSIISYTVNNECGVATSTVTVSVSTTAILDTIYGLSTLCTGDTTTLYAVPATGIWTSSHPPTATVDSLGRVVALSAGTTIISYSVTNECGTSTTTKNIYVNPLPNAGTITGGVSVCVGSELTLYSSATGGVWSSSENVSVNSMGIITGLAAGTAIISYTVTTECGTATATTMISVNPTPSAGSIIGASSVCAASTTTLSNTTGGGTWSSSNTSIASVDSTGVVTGFLVGSSTISYIIGNECGTAVAIKTITVNPLPYSGTITGSVSVCIGSELTLYNSETGGVWSSSENVSVNSIGIITGLAAGTATISYTVANDCGASAATTIISVNPIPTAGTIIGTSSVCIGSYTTLSISTGGGSWSSTNISVASVDSLGVVTGNTVGTTTIAYTVSNECGVASATIIITVNPIPNAGTITGASFVDDGASITLSNAATGGTWSTSYPDIATVGSTGVVTGVSAGTVIISYTVTNSCGSVSATKTVTVNAVLETAIDGTLTVCEGSTTTLTNTTSGGSWSSSNTLKAVVNTEGMVTGINAGTTIISYTLSGISVTAIVTVNALPVAGTLSGATSVCIGSTATVSKTGTGGEWSSSVPEIATVGSTGIVSGLTAGTTTISYTVGNGCGSVAATRLVTVIALPDAGTISGASPICRTTTTTLTSSVSGGTWSSNYPAGATVNASTGLVTAVAAGAVIISYRMNNSCGTSYAIFPISILSAPSLGVISGSTTVCASATTTLTNTTAGGTWSSTNTGAATINASTGAVTGATAGTTTISYNVTNMCGSATVSKTLTVNPLPVAAVISGTTTLSAGTTTTLTATPSGGTWLSASGTIVSINTSGVATGLAAGVATVSYTRTNSCGSVVTTVAVTVTTATTPITGVRVVCQGSTTSLANATTGGTWSIADAAIATIGTTGIVTGVSAGTTTVTYTFSSGGNVTATVTVNAAPAAYTGSGIICTGSQLNLGSIIPGCTWTSGNTARATVVSATGIVTGGTTLGTVNISYTNAATCRTTTQLTVNAAVGATTGISSPCVGSSFTALNSTPGGTWSSSNTARATIDAASGLLTAVGGGTVTISYTLSAGCVRTTTVTVGTPPAIMGNPSICFGQTSTLVSSGGTWSSSNASIAAVAASGIVTGVSLGTAVITYRSTANALCFVTQPVTVNPVPSTIVAPSALCPGQTATLTSSPAGGTWTSNVPANASVDPSTGVVTAVIFNYTTISAVNITYTLPTGCGGIATVTINPLPSPISGNRNICTGSTTTLTSSTAGSTWSSASPAIASIAGGVVTGVSAGLATISYTNALGCANTAEITVNAMPGANTGSASLCLPTTATSTLSNAAGAGTWSSNNTTKATVNFSSGLVTGINTGTANITYTKAAGCISVTQVTVTICGARPGATEDTDGNNVFSVSPNPTTGAINLTTSILGKVEIYTIDGKLLEKYEAKAGTTSISLPSGIASGVYMLRFNGAGGSSKMVRLVYQQ